MTPSEMLPRPARRSWWMEEALAADPGEPCPSLESDLEVDAVVLGGGYTGLWAAWFLAEREPGMQIAVLEQDICGGGPSGANGGFCNAFWDELPALVRRLGAQEALRVAEVAGQSIAEIGAWCEGNGVDAWYTAGGHLGVATSEVQDDAWMELVETAARLGVADEHLTVLSPEEVRSRCDSPVFRAGLLSHGSAIVQPARLARGLRGALLRRGVRIFEHTWVRSFDAGPPVTAVTPGGVVRAPRGVLALGTWSHALARFRRLVLPRGSYMVVTAPAPDRLAELGWIGGEGIYDYRTSLRYLRPTPDGRIAFGAAGSTAGLGAGLASRMYYDDLCIARLVRDVKRFFPPFRDVPIEAGWGGPLDITGLHLPFFGVLPGSALVYACGYTGGGVGPCHFAGKVLSGLALGREDEYTTLSLVRLQPKPFPPDPLLSVGAYATYKAIVAKDEAEDEGRRAGMVTDFVARLPRRLGYELGP